MSPISPACTVFRDAPAVRYVADAEAGGDGVFSDGAEAARGSEAPSAVTSLREFPFPIRDTVSNSWFSRVMLATGSSVPEGRQP